MISMKNVLAGVFLVTCPVLCHAYFSQDNAGEEAFSFISTFDSPRNASLERSAGASPSTDPSITQLNPASLKVQEGKTYIFQANWQTGDIAENQGSLYFTTNYNKYALQLAYNWYDVGTIDGVNTDGNYNGEKYDPIGHLITGTIAYPMKYINFGASLKFIAERLSVQMPIDRMAFGVAFDWGISWQSKDKIVGLALAARDMGVTVRDYTDDNEDDHFPLSQTFSISGYLHPKSIRRMTIYTSTDAPRFGQANFNLGAEYALGESFTIRGGWTRSWLDIIRDIKELAASEDRPDESNENRLLSLGLGYSSRLFALDYSFSYLAEDFGMEHRIGLRVGF